MAFDGFRIRRVRSSAIDFDFDIPVDRRGTSSLKWDRYKGTDVIPMWVADMDFRSPPAVIEALRSRVEHGVFGYSDAPKELTDLIVAMLQRKYHWTIEREWIVWLPGLVTGLNVACRSAGGAGDSVITNVPAYPPFLSTPRNASRDLIQVPLVQQENRWGFDFNLIKAAMTPQTRMFILCNPHNPTGRVYTRDELNRLVQMCQEHDLIICSDEIHCDLILDEDKRHIPTASLNPEVADRTITLMAPSKTYNLPGLGCSLAIISNDDLRSRFRSAMAGIVPHVNALGFAAALAAYRFGEPWLSELLTYLRRNRDTVETAIDRIPGLSMSHIEATYLAWIDARSTGVEDPSRFFEDAGVGLSDGKYFGTPGYVRLNFGCPHATLVEALQRMSRAISARGGR